MDPSNRILRQRKARDAGEIFRKEQSPLSRTIKKLDFYPKVQHDRLKKQTFPGMVISLAVTAVIVMMLMSEMAAHWYGWDAKYDRISVASGISSDVMVNLNITFPRLKCTSLHMDAIDAAGQSKVNLHTGLYKSPVSKEGRLIFAGAHPHYRPPPESDAGHQDKQTAGIFPFLNVDYDPTLDPTSKQFCGPCEIYSAANMDAERRRKKGEAVKCCNTCDSVLAYHKETHGRTLAKGDVEQCIHEESEKHPGCNIAGFLMVERVKGNFHFSPGGTTRVGFKLLHTFTTQQELEYDVTHQIHQFSFGDPVADDYRFDTAHTHPLDKRVYIVPRNMLSRMRYFVKAIPVVLADQSTEAAAEEAEGAMLAGAEKKASSYELSVRKHDKVFVPGDPTNSPSLSFDYDFYHMQITHVFDRQPLSRFLLRVCEIVGGLFVVTGFLDRLVGKVLVRLS